MGRTNNRHHSHAIAEFLAQIAQLYYNFRKFDSAKEHLAMCLQIRHETCGSRHPELFGGLYLLMGHIMRGKQEGSEAVTYYKKALKCFERFDTSNLTDIQYCRLYLAQ